MYAIRRQVYVNERRFFYVKIQCSNPVHGEMYSIQHYVIKLVSDLRQVGAFLRVHKTNGSKDDPNIVFTLKK
jgi:hypothetical protein